MQCHLHTRGAWPGYSWEGPWGRLPKPLIFNLTLTKDARPLVYQTLLPGRPLCRCPTHRHAASSAPRGRQGPWGGAPRRAWPPVGRPGVLQSRLAQPLRACAHGCPRGPQDSGASTPRMGSIPSKVLRALVTAWGPGAVRPPGDLSLCPPSRLRGGLSSRLLSPPPTPLRGLWTQPFAEQRMPLAWLRALHTPQSDHQNTKAWPLLEVQRVGTEAGEVPTAASSPRGHESCSSPGGRGLRVQRGTVHRSHGAESVRSAVEMPPSPALPRPPPPQLSLARRRPWEEPVGHPSGPHCRAQRQLPESLQCTRVLTVACPAWGPRREQLGTRRAP